MHRWLRVRCFAAGLSGLWLLTGVVAAAQAQAMRDLVEQVLDQEIEGIQIADVPLPEALEQLGKETGLRFEMDRQAMAWMPYGEQTRVSIDLAGISVRKGLRRTFAGLGLSMRVEGDRIVIEASPALDCLGRRMKIEDVRLFTNLASGKWSELAADSRPLQKGRGLDRSLEATIGPAPGASALEQLENAGQTGRWCWKPLGGMIFIITRASDVRERLERPVDLDYRGVLLDEMLIDLGRRVGVTILFEPGVLERIQAGSRKVDLVHRKTTVRQALELISGRTGISYTLSEAGVLVRSLEGQKLGPRPAGARIVATLRVPIGDDGTTIEFPFYEDDVPPEFERLRQSKLPQVIEELRRREER